MREKKVEIKMKKIKVLCAIVLDFIIMLRGNKLWLGTWFNHSDLGQAIQYHTCTIFYFIFIAFSFIKISLPLKLYHCNSITLYSKVNLCSYTKREYRPF